QANPRYWLTPPDVYAALDAEFCFDFDPCPHPRPGGFNGLAVPWGASNYVNPPFCRKDAPEGGPSAFARKAIAERALGRTSVIILPVPNSIGLLLEAGAEIRYGGQIRWLDADTRKPCGVARRQLVAVLKGE
ncbi:MAG: phage N-6-adenine-methyltransferase, partial [Synergistaceae bacterium]|nr:phage N-6-adenine-methyltransferase [Synergistaceae bacterium]